MRGGVGEVTKEEVAFLKESVMVVLATKRFVYCMKKKIHNPLAKKPTNKNNQKGFRFFLARIVTYCNTEKKRFLLLMLVLFLGIGIGGISVHQNMVEKPVIATEEAITGFSTMF